MRKNIIKNFSQFVNESIISNKQFIEIIDNGMIGDSGDDGETLRIAENDDGTLFLIKYSDDEYMLIFEPFDGTQEVQEMGPYMTLEEADRIFNKYTNSEDVIDRLLEKIKRDGLSSLSSDEMELLDKNSRSF
jgi:hypothetical protein